jgi:gliding motility-associated-like protein
MSTGQKKFLFILAVFITFGFTFCYATHIVGGEMNYRYLGNNDYEIRLTVYRDCFNGIPPFDDPAALGIFDANNNLLNTVYMVYTGSTPLVPTINSPCLIPPTNICYERTTYVDIVNLPPIPGGYQLVYQRCCRNNTIVNIVNPGNAGATYMATIPDVSIAAANNNPVFSNWPPVFICANVPFTFDHSATDSDGDLLVYELCDPLDGASQGNPMPQPPFNPPYLPITWQAPYSPANILGGVPLTINAQTGMLSCTPNTQGQFVYGVCVKEYRNGNLLSTTRRDYQINVTACPQIVVSSIQSPTLVCGQLTAFFTNNSVGAASYFWNFGDPLNASDTSHLANPTYTYSDTGHYQAMLIAYSGVNTACNDTSFGDVYVYPPLQASFSYQNIPCMNTVNFQDMTSTLSSTVNSWLWDFGDNTTSTQQNPTHVYSAPGNYVVTLIAASVAGCIDTATIPVDVIVILPTSAFTYMQEPCKGNCSFINLSSGGMYSWNFGDGDSSYQQNPVHTYSGPGVYNVTLITTLTPFCADTLQQIVNINSFPRASFTIQHEQCSFFADFVNTSTGTQSWQWSFGDTATSSLQSPSHTYSAAGVFPVTLIGTDVFGCTDTARDNITVIALSHAGFTYSIDTCGEQVLFINDSRDATTYYWDFGDFQYSSDVHPVHSYPVAGSFTVTLISNYGQACPDTATMPLILDVSMIGNIWVPNVFTPNGDRRNETFEVIGSYPCDEFEFNIFSRWGELIYEGKGPHVSWDGTYKGKLVADDVYVYILTNKTIKRIGSIAVIR